MNESVVGGADEALGVEGAHLYARNHVPVRRHHPHRVYDLVGWCLKKVVLIYNQRTHGAC